MLVYAMTTTQSALWEQGGQGAAQVQAQIAQTIYAAGCADDVLVTLADGQIAYGLSLYCEPLTAANNSSLAPRSITGALP